MALGHTRDDQAETVLMGLGRAAGLAGLSGMRRAWVDGGRVVPSPASCGAGREELRDWLRAQGMPWIDDPTNENPRFTRVKARQALAALAPLGITAERLAEVAGHLARVQEALGGAGRGGGRHVVEVAGALRLDEGLWAEPLEVQRQVVDAAVGWLVGRGTRPGPMIWRGSRGPWRRGAMPRCAGCRARQGWLMREARRWAGRCRWGRSGTGAGR